MRSISECEMRPFEKGIRPREWAALSRCEFSPQAMWRIDIYSLGGKELKYFTHGIKFGIVIW